MMKCVAGWFCLILKTSVWGRWRLEFWVAVSVVITAGRGECGVTLSHVSQLMRWCRDVFVFSVKAGDVDSLLQDFGLCSYQLIKAISIMEERFGITAPILFLRGSVSQHFTQWLHLKTEDGSDSQCNVLYCVYVRALSVYPIAIENIPSLALVRTSRSVGGKLSDENS